MEGVACLRPFFVDSYVHRGWGQEQGSCQLAFRSMEVGYGSKLAPMSVEDGGSSEAIFSQPLSPWWVGTGVRQLSAGL